MQFEKTRAFICIDFPDKIVKEVARIQQILLKKQFIGKPTELNNLHLTLKFLSHISKQKLNKTKLLLKQIKFPKLELSLNHIGTFTYKSKPKIIWIKVTGNIFDLQKQIDLILSPLFKVESRFMSHLTIARIKFVKNSETFKKYIKQIKIKKIKFTIDSFKLKSSELTPLGPIYTTIQAYKATN